MSLFSTDTVAVTLIDEATGDKLATSQVPVEQLPDSFALDTSLEVAGQPYTVARAEPVTKLEFAHAKRLTLFLRKVEMVNPKDILFSLPTICGAALPETVKGKSSGGVCVLHEDDWRQCELISLAHAADIAAELAGIQNIYATASKEVGWTKLHVRDRIPRPLPPALKWKDVTSRLGRLDPLGGIAFGDPRNLVRGAVCGSMRNGMVLWGIESSGALSVLSLQNAGLAAPSTVTAIKAVAADLSLAIVDWCRCRVYSQGPLIEGTLGDPWDEVQ